MHTWIDSRVSIRLSTWKPFEISSNGAVSLRYQLGLGCGQPIGWASDGFYTHFQCGNHIGSETNRKVINLKGLAKHSWPCLWSPLMAILLDFTSLLIRLNCRELNCTLKCTIITFMVTWCVIVPGIFDCMFGQQIHLGLKCGVCYLTAATIYFPKKYRFMLDKMNRSQDMAWFLTPHVVVPRFRAFNQSTKGPLVIHNACFPLIYFVFFSLFSSLGAIRDYQKYFLTKHFFACEWVGYAHFRF